MAYRRVNDLNFLTDDEYEDLCDSFTTKFERRGPDECWPWVKGKAFGGRGQVTLHGQTVPAPRVAYILYVGDIPEHDSHHGLVVRHSCDNPPCVNPAHLTVGTQKENLRDRDFRGRTPKGEKHAKARITEAIVLAVRRDPRNATDISAAFGITPSMVGNIKSYRVWKHLPPSVEDVPVPLHLPPEKRPPRGGRKPGRKLKAVPAAAVADIQSSTEINRVLAQKHGLSVSMVWGIRNKTKDRPVT